MSGPLKLGIAGLGTVGGGVIKILLAHGPRLAAACGRKIEIAAVCARNHNARRAVDISPYRWVAEAEELARSEGIDVFVELIGGEDDPALGAVKAAIGTGKSVVTANKALIARHGLELAALAEQAGVALAYEASVAGGIPIVKLLRENLISNHVEHIAGILNGTCNYILTLMERDGMAFAEALKDAQDKGYAEADPSFDIGGIDAAHKLAIVTTLAFGTELSFDDIYVEGIEKITPEDLAAANELGFTIKLLGVAQQTPSGIEQRVHPALVPRDRPIADVSGVFNALAVRGDFLGDMMIEGEGAGEGATASAVIADICDIASGRAAPVFGVPVKALQPYKRGRMRAHEGRYYLRLLLHDKPGAMAAVANCMAKQNISLDSIVQKGQTARHEASAGQDDEAGTMQVVLVTHETTEALVRASLDAISEDGFIAAEPAMIRVEND
jgi:homoserine dehydrogenase